MDRFKEQRRPKNDDDESPPPDFDGLDENHGAAAEVDGGDQTPLAGGNARRKASHYREYNASAWGI